MKKINVVMIDSLKTADNSISNGKNKKPIFIDLFCSSVKENQI
jgi:hypothetical protein